MFLLALALQLIPLDEAAYRQLIAARAGQPVIVDFWATWCEPCRKELPKLVSLTKRMGTTLITVSSDEPEQTPAVLASLRQARVKFPAYIKDAGADDRFINQVDPGWSGVLPALFLYDRSGKLIQSFTGETDLRLVEQALRRLL